MWHLTQGQKWKGGLEQIAQCVGRATNHPAPYSESTLGNLPKATVVGTAWYRREFVLYGKSNNQRNLRRVWWHCNVSFASLNRFPRIPLPFNFLSDGPQKTFSHEIEKDRRKAPDIL